MQTKVTHYQTEALSQFHTSRKDMDEPLSFPPSGENYNAYPPESEAYVFLQSLIPQNLTIEEERAIENYAYGDMDVEMNKLVESGGSNPDTESLDRAILKTRLPRPLVVYRGLGPVFSDPQDSQRGTMNKVRRYVSVTLDEALARSWRGSRTVQRIELPTGMPVAVANIEEAELILPHGLSFETQGGTKVNSGNLEYTLEDVKAHLPEIDATEAENPSNTLDVDPADFSSVNAAYFDVSPETTTPELKKPTRTQRLVRYLGKISRKG